MPQDQLVLYLLNSMPEEYVQTVVFLRMQPPASLTFDHVCNTLLAAEITFSTKKRKVAASYHAQTQARTRAIGRVSRVDTPKSTDNSNGPVSKCSLCNKNGHLRENCFQDPRVGYPSWYVGKRVVAGDTTEQSKGESAKKAKKRPTRPLLLHRTTTATRRTMSPRTKRQKGRRARRRSASTTRLLTPRTLKRWPQRPS